MSATRHLSWTAAMHELAADRTKRPLVREEPLRAPLRGPHALTTWRGASGQRHVFSVVPLARAEEYCEPTDVAIAVRRDDDGIAIPIAARTMGDRTRDLGWLAACCAQFGATELHVCGIFGTPGLARIAARDLTVAPPARTQSAA